MKRILLFGGLLLSFSGTSQNIDFPDPVLKNALVNLNCVDIGNDYTTDTTADTDGDGEISIAEAEAVTSLQLFGLGITSTEGLQYFTNLNILVIASNNLMSLDVSMFPALQELACNHNQLTSLTLGNLPDLGVLQAGTNQLTSIDMSQTPSIWHMGLQNNQLTSVDVSNLADLLRFEINHNLITTLDLNNHFGFEGLWCNNNPNLTQVSVKNGQADAYGFFVASDNPALVQFCVDPGDTFAIFSSPVPASNCTLDNADFDRTKISFHPNPTSDRIYFNEIVDSAQLFDATGRMVREYNNSFSAIDFSAFEKGVYVLRYSVGNADATAKIVRR